MANRTIQFKRNTNQASNALEAKQNMSGQSLANGELIIGTYSASNSVNGNNASVLGIQSQGKMFFVDNQTILDKLGIKDDGTEDANASNDSFSKKVIALEENASDANDKIGNIIDGVGLNNDGSYTPNPSDPYTSGETSLKDALSKISTEVAVVEDFIGMSGGTTGGTPIAEKVDELSDEIDEVSGKVETLEDNIEAVSGVTEDLGDDIESVSGAVSDLADDLSELSSFTNDLKDDIETVSGDVEDIKSEISSITEDISDIKSDINTISVDVEDLTADVEALSGKSITTVEDTTTIDMTKETADDGTKKIKADVKISNVTGNVIDIKTDGIYTQVDYDALTNSLIVNGVEKPLNVGSIISGMVYDNATEKLIIYYDTTSGGSGSTEVDMKDLIEEYTYPAKDENHNVGFTVTRNVSGATEIQADVNLIDCGEY